MLSEVDAARLLGMKPGEIVAVRPAGDGGCEVTTHDGTVTRIDADGTLTVCPREATGVPGVQALPVDDLAGARADVRVVDAELFAVADAADLAELGLARIGDELATAAGGESGGVAEGDDAAEVIGRRAVDVLAWVAGSAARARSAIELESGREQPPPRSSLLADLRKVIKDAEQG